MPFFNTSEFFYPHHEKGQEIKTIIKEKCQQLSRHSTSFLLTQEMRKKNEGKIWGRN
jgi:hypothetical protein